MTHATHSKLRFHKFASQNIMKICGFFKGQIMVQICHWTCKVHLNASNFGFLNVRTYPCKNLYRFQHLKVTKIRNFFSRFQVDTSTLIWATCADRMLSKILSRKIMKSHLSNALSIILLAPLVQNSWVSQKKWEIAFL